MNKNKEQLLALLGIGDANHLGTNEDYAVLDQVLQACQYPTEPDSVYNEDQCYVIQQYWEQVVNHPDSRMVEDAKGRLQQLLKQHDNDLTYALMALGEENKQKRLKNEKGVSSVEETTTSFPAPSPGVPSESSSDSHAETGMSFLDMMERAAEILKRSLDTDDITGLLNQSGLTWAEGYKAEQVQRFFTVCQRKAVKEEEKPKTVPFYQLVQKAIKIIGKSVGLDEVKRYLGLAGLKRSDKYSEDEVRQFEEICTRIKDGEKPEQILSANNPLLQTAQGWGQAQSNETVFRLYGEQVKVEEQLLSAFREMYPHLVAQELKNGNAREHIQRIRMQIASEQANDPVFLGQVNAWITENIKKIDQVPQQKQIEGGD